ncbi:MAG: metallophosphoesterase [Mangrovibacterium sp.]|nr:metallophosphoesterase [Mangrovibacterium sp.]
MKQLFQKITLLLIVQLVLVFQSGAQPENPLKLSDPASWTMVLLPDPQSYVKFERNQPVMDLVTAWIKANLEELNIRLVMCTGDLVESNNAISPEPRYGGDQSAWQQWEAISQSFKKLDHEVPYILCVGNHDMEMSPARYSQFNSWFGPDRNPLSQKILVDMFPNASGVKTLENACYEFISPHGVPFLIFSLEFLPRDTIVMQAIRVAQNEKYKNHKGIILTHSYLGSDNNRRKIERYPLDGARGEELWQRIIAPSTNIEMVLCGHVAGLSHKEHVGYRIDKNAGGKNVYQILFNAQWEGGGPNGNGGDGWIRILEFLPDKKTVFVKTFSPLFAISPETIDKAFRTENYDQFTFDLF